MEDTIHELFPLAAGILVALIVLRLGTVRHHVAAFDALGLAFGVVATVISGEWRTG